MTFTHCGVWRKSAERRAAGTRKWQRSASACGEVPRSTSLTTRASREGRAAGCVELVRCVRQIVCHQTGVSVSKWHDRREPLALDRDAGGGMITSDSGSDDAMMLATICDLCFVREVSARSLQWSRTMVLADFDQMKDIGFWFHDSRNASVCLYKCCFGREVSSANVASSENAEEPFDLVHPRCALGREVKFDARVFVGPLPDFGSLVGRRVV